MTKTDLVVVGFPRSGNTWLSRLLGDVLNSPVGGMYTAKPLATEGQERPGRYHVRQLHLRPTEVDEGKAIPNAWTFSVPYLGQVKLVHVIRDPRDVAISVFYWWQMENIQQAVDVICHGGDPIQVHGSWPWYVGNWINLGIPVIRYEDLWENPRGELERILTLLDIPYRADTLDPAIGRQSFDRKQEQITRDGASRPYGRHLQLKHLRKGIVGDYKNHLSPSQQDQVWDRCEPIMRRCGYNREDL